MHHALLRNREAAGHIVRGSVGFKIDVYLALRDYIARALINLEIVTENPVRTISFLPIQNDVGVLEFNALEILRLLEVGGADLENGSPAVRLRVRESLRDLRGILRQAAGSYHRVMPRLQNPAKIESCCHQHRQHGSGSKELSHQLEIEGHGPLSILLFCGCGPHRQCGIGSENCTLNQNSQALSSSATPSHATRDEDESKDPENVCIHKPAERHSLENALTLLGPRSVLGILRLRAHRVREKPAYRG